MLLVADYAFKSLMQYRIASDLGHAVAQDQAIGP